eukprot:scaffold82706_cov23-Prasinocladus_malaysianus.AAC.1
MPILLDESFKTIDSAWSIFSSALSADPTLVGPIGGARLSGSQTKETPTDAQSPPVWVSMYRKDSLAEKCGQLPNAAPAAEESTEIQPALEGAETGKQEPAEGT